MKAAILLLVAFVGLGEWNLEFDWLAGTSDVRVYREAYSDINACRVRAEQVARMLLKTIPQGSTDYFYTWQCTTAQMPKL